MEKTPSGNRQRPRLTLLCDREGERYSINLRIPHAGPNRRQTANRWKRALLQAVAVSIPRPSRQTAGRALSGLFFDPFAKKELSLRLKAEPFTNAKAGFRILLPLDEWHLPNDDKLVDYLKKVTAHLKRAMARDDIEHRRMP